METLITLFLILIGSYLFLLLVFAILVSIAEIQLYFWQRKTNKESKIYWELENLKDELIQLKISKTHSQEVIENFLVSHYGVKTITELDSKNYKEVLNFLEKL